ncbi:MAG: phytanoyl-CoA dioxygenase family protein [Bacteroidetes bacterium]|nr:phytanoyl-CoA dioxygenase family protein [Bacteroidota bacterium]
MPNIPTDVLDFLEQPYQLTQEQIDHYERYRYIKLKEVLSPAVVSFYAEVISQKVTELNRETASIDHRNTYGKAFLQIFNLWGEDERIKALVFSKRLAKIATDLMQTRGARLYHDQALFKEPSGGYTPWHADQYYWPLETDKTVTAWMPLQAVGLNMGPLEFSAGSHVIIEGRELAISDDSENFIEQKLRVTDFDHVVEAFELGEISFHSGWVFHRAGPNETDQMRKVMTTIYMDEEMKLKKPENENQVNDWHTWCPGAIIGEEIQSPINPLLFTYSNK